MPNLSFWEKESFFKNIDIAVIGSGIVGLTTAIFLKKENPALQVAILEKGSLPLGASTRNAGFACFGSMTELLDDLESRPEEEVFALVRSRWEGLINLRNLVGDENLGYKPLGGFEIFRQEEESLFEKCLTNMARFNEMMAKITKQPATYVVADQHLKQFGFKGISHIIHNTAEGQINTGAMMRSLLKIARQLGVQFFFGIAVKAIEDAQNQSVVITENGWEIKAKRALVATNGFSKKLLPELEIQPARNQVLITEPIDNLPFRGAFHYDRGYYYFRSVETNGKFRILLGGGRNLSPEAERTEEFGLTDLIQNELKSLLRNVILPDQTISIESWWSGILGVGEIKKPILKMVSPSVGVAVRLGGMGVAIGSQIGKDAARMLVTSLSKFH
ncbi:MAG: FAD-binding oxidoreductase [Bacteroidota bacterium]